MKQTKKSSRPPTMHDVARLAGVSQPTVSRVLNKANTAISISEETRSKVNWAIAELDYRPNMNARSLRTQRTFIIAVLVADITNTFYPQIAYSIQKVCQERGYDVMIANSNHLYENEIKFCEAIARRGVDGIIAAPIHLSLAELDDLYTRTNIPISLLGQHIDHPEMDVIYADDERASYEAVRWLINERGHQRLGYVGVPNYLPPGPRRRRGFMQALSDCGLEALPEHLFEGDFTLESGKRVGQELLRIKHNLPSALFVANDPMAIGVILTLQEDGIRVPDDIAIVGFDNIPEASIIRPALTTIAQDPVDMGYKLAVSLLERIENPELPSRYLESQTHLLVRDSA